MVAPYCGPALTLNSILDILDGYIDANKGLYEFSLVIQRRQEPFGDLDESIIQCIANKCQNCKRLVISDVRELEEEN